MILALGHDLQRRIDRQRIFETDVLLDSYGQESASEWFEQKLEQYEGAEQRYDLKKHMFDILDEMEILRSDWPVYTKHVRKILFGDGREGYFPNFSQFDQICKNSEDFTVQMEQILVYFIFTYFCGAVYDGNAYGKVKMAAVSTFWIKDMVQAYWTENKKMPELGEMCRIVWSYSRELEHSNLNLQKIEEVLMGNKLFSLENLLICV